MRAAAVSNPTDTETQVFYALSLIATAPPADRSHANQKHAAAILEPIYRENPDHPGAAHYLIHAYDSAELAPRGLAAARAYSKIAPSSPRAPRRTVRVTRAKNCTRWIIWCTRTCSADGKPRRSRWWQL